MNKCTKFRANPLTLGFSGHIKGFQALFGTGTQSPSPKNENFGKLIQKQVQIHKRNKCTKLHANPTIFELSKLPKSFGSHNIDLPGLAQNLFC